ncbi:MAG: polysaccharide deacetylase family protein [Acidobacteriota bacterium]|jgi:peptidoglycan/xylan/chitin deacetylase (PgdA/CDA1 family)
MISAIVLTFHGVVTKEADLAGIADPGSSRYAVTTARLKETLDIIGQFSVCVVRDLAAAKEARHVLTFDDGLLSDYEIVFPELIARDLKATFFVSALNVGREGYCSGSQLVEMARSGMEIASHGCTHRYLVTMARREAIVELAQSKAELEYALGTHVASFAAVGGHYRDWMIAAAADAGYRAFATMIPGRTLIRAERILRLRRNHIQADHGPEYIARVLRGEFRTLASNRLRYLVLDLARRALGMNAYDRLRARLLTST